MILCHFFQLTEPSDEKVNQIFSSTFQQVTKLIQNSCFMQSGNWEIVIDGQKLLYVRTFLTVILPKSYKISTYRTYLCQKDDWHLYSLRNLLSKQFFFFFLQMSYTMNGYNRNLILLLCVKDLVNRFDLYNIWPLSMMATSVLKAHPARKLGLDDARPLYNDFGLQSKRV